MSGSHQNGPLIIYIPCNLSANGCIYYNIEPSKQIIMKRLIMLAASVIAVFSLTSCEPEMSRAIIGTWEATSMEATVEGINMNFELEKMGLSMTFIFKENGTGTLVEKVEGETMSMDFDYSIEDGLLTLDSEGDIETVPVSIDGKKMTMVLDGEDILDEPGSNVKIYFTKK